MGSTGIEPVAFRVWGGRATAAPTARICFNLSRTQSKETSFIYFIILANFIAFELIILIYYNSIMEMFDTTDKDKQRVYTRLDNK